MIRLPSYRAAVIAGAIGVPLVMFGAPYAKSNQTGGLFIFVWYVLIGFLPMILSTVDFSNLKEIRGRGTSISQLPYRCYEAFTCIVVPMWKRMAAYLASGALSFILVSIGRDLIGL
jgi:hypothetical protein